MEYNYNGPERRRFIREKAHFIVNYKISQPPEVIMSLGQREIEAVMMDLSEGGIALITQYDIPEGTVVKVNWTLINPYTRNEDRIRDFELRAEVRSCVRINDDDYRIGVNFVELGGGDRRAIADFIENHRRKE